MKSEIQSIISNLENTLDGSPWFGRPVFALLREIDTSQAHKKLSPSSHSMMDLLYHMITWSDFTLKRIEKEKINDMAAFEKMDWREINPNTHDWDEALAELIATHQQIIALLLSREDSFLDEIVDYREYNFRYLLNGLIQHNIYHVGQVALLSKLLA